MADTDSGQDVEETAEDSTVNPQMGDGLFEDVSTPAVGNNDDTSSGAQDTTTGYSGEAATAEPDSSQNQPDFNPSAVDLLRVNMEEVPESHRSLAQNAQNALKQMQSGFTQSQQELFDRLKEFIVGGVAGETMAVRGATLKGSEGAIRVAVHRLRAKYRRALRDEIASTLNEGEDLEEEIQALFAVFQ